MSADHEDDNTIFWSDDYFLKWEDFRGEPDLQKTAEAESNVGLDIVHELEYEQTQSKIKFRFKKFTVKAIFLKATSWKKDNMLEHHKPYVLNHEQGRFDIAQEYVHVAYERLHYEFDSKSYSVKGKTQDEIANNGRRISDKMAKAVMDEVFSKFDATQQEYENETKYGTIDQKQKVYDERFKKLRK